CSSDLFWRSTPSSHCPWASPPTNCARSIAPSSRCCTGTTARSTSTTPTAGSCLRPSSRRGARRVATTGRSHPTSSPPRTPVPGSTTSTCCPSSTSTARPTSGPPTRSSSVVSGDAAKMASGGRYGPPAIVREVRVLTRLEVDGFKNLLDFSVEFGPFTCIAGPNAIGKSNVFDAIQFLSLLADRTFIEAAAELRTPGVPAVDLASLFWAGATHGARMRFGAEFVVDRQVQDDFGRDAEPTATFLRYDLELEYLPASDSFGSDRIGLVREELGYITRGEAPRHLRWEHSKGAFRDEVVVNRRKGSAYISTTLDGDSRIINVHQDGGSHGRGRKSPAYRAPRTVVSTTTTSDDPTVLAARNEMLKWRILALEPSALRRPDSITDPTELTETGEHMPAALRRITALRGQDTLDLI